MATLFAVQYAGGHGVGSGRAGAVSDRSQQCSRLGQGRLVSHSAQPAGASTGLASGQFKIGRRRCELSRIFNVWTDRNKMPAARSLGELSNHTYLVYLDSRIALDFLECEKM